MRVVSIQHLSLESLLGIADQEGIPVQSRISRCIVQADLMSADGTRLQIEDLVECTPLKGDLLGRLLAVEAGVNYFCFEPSRSEDNEPTKIKVRKWLKEQGVFEEYLGNLALVSAVSAVIYERKIPVPQFLWYKAQLGVTKYIFSMCVENFRQEVSRTKDDTPQEYLERREFSCFERSFLPFLLYQKTEHLLALANSLPNPSPFFQTRAGILDYLYWRYECNEKLDQRYLGFFSEINEEYYPGRCQMIEAIYGRKGFKQIPSYFESPSQELLLALPPVWFEQIYCQTLLYNPDIHQFLGRLRELFPVLNFLDLDTESEQFTKIVRIALNADLKLRPNSRLELARLLKTKNFERVHPQTIYQLTGWGCGSNLYDMLWKIEENIGSPEFHIVINLDLVPVLDFLREPHEDFVITFGTFTDYVCYSPEDLIASFVVADNFVAFRKPNQPNEVFTHDQMDELLTLLSEYPPDKLSEYRNRVRPLIDKIQEGLSEERPVDIDDFTQKLLELSSDDQKQAGVVFRNFFQAGMYQRTWDGIGHYPMSYNQTCSLSLEEIEIRMTPVLNNIQESYDLMSKEGQDFLDCLPVIDYVETVFIRRADPLLSFESQTRRGEFCIGYGSRLMIYSGYFYLSALGIDIPDFDILRFEPESTHR